MTGSVVAKGLRLITLSAWLSAAALAASLGVVPAGASRVSQLTLQADREFERGQYKKAAQLIHGPLVWTRRMTEFATSRDAPMRGWLKVPAFLVFYSKSTGELSPCH